MNMNDDILVSIITVSHNSEKMIAKAIESVLNQTYSRIEYLIIDGASKDRTVEIAKSYISKFNEVEGKSLKIVSEPDEGMYDALNKGIKLAKGVLIGNINTDDWYEPNAVQEMVNLYHEKNYDLAWADLKIIKESGDIIKKAHIGKLWTTAGFCHPTMFARRNVLLEFPYACKQMDDDFDMVTRAYKAGKKIEVLNKTLANYVFGGMSTKKSLKQSFNRVMMKYHTYRRNNFSSLYMVYCVSVEIAKYILG